MGNITGFLDIPRKERDSLSVAQRVGNFDEFVLPLKTQQLREQGARCMDCGIPYCHNGCPVHNLIPDWNDLVHNDHWRRALDTLHATNNFPEFTGRICPAPCETACTLYLHDHPVIIKTIEHAIVERGWAENWIQPQPAAQATGKGVAIVGSGPAGLACAQQLARAGHAVSVFEKQARSGGLLTFGIPDFKLDKQVVARRLQQLQAEGVAFHHGVHVGVDLAHDELLRDFDAVVLSGGAEQPRDLDIPGRDGRGVHFAMEYLCHNNARVFAEKHRESAPESAPDLNLELSARDKRVVVIGGGDTGSDCIGTAIRQGARSVTQIEILSQPPEREDKSITWPNWPHKLRTSSSQEEGCQRIWDVNAQEFILDANGCVTAVRCVKVAWHKQARGWAMKQIPDSEFILGADLVTLAMGFLHPTHAGLLQQLGVDLNQRGCVAATDTGKTAYQTSLHKVFTAGDMRRGQSLVVWAIREGRQCAAAVDAYLRGSGSPPS